MGSANASVTTPGKGVVSPQTGIVLANPWSGFAEEAIPFRVKLAPEAKAFVVRFYLDFTALSLGVRELKRVEVPINIKTVSRAYSIYEDIYPRPVRRTSSQRDPNAWDSFYFRTCAYRMMIERIYQSEIDARFVQAVFKLIQIDEPLYNYYSVANAFQDPHSIRTDVPDFTNIKGGIGVFGSTSIDSTLWSLPERMYPPLNTPETHCRN